MDENHNMMMLSSVVTLLLQYALVKRHITYNILVYLSIYPLQNTLAPYLIRITDKFLIAHAKAVLFTDL